MAERYALTNLKIVTADREGTVLPPSTIVVDENGRIEDVQPADNIPAGIRRFDLTGHYAMPGLINAHAHLFSNGKPLPPFMTSERGESALSALLKTPVGRTMVRRRTRQNLLTQLHSGVTTVRSLGDTGYEVVAVGAEIEAGRMTGPRVLAAGPLLAATGGHGAPQIALTSDSPWEARRNVRKNLRQGVTAIKIAATGGVTDARHIGEAGRAQMTEEEMTAICDEAHTAGLVVAAHAQGQQGILAALRAGVDTIEHGAAMTPEIIELFLDNPRALRGASGVVPTLMAAIPIVKLDPALTKMNEIVRANGRIIFEQMIHGIHDALENGIDIGMGTDSALTYVTHYNGWREMDFVIRFGGLTAAQALNAATQVNARLLGLDHVTGQIAPGLDADIIITADNPLEKISALADLRMVIARGTVIDRPAVTKFPEIDEALDRI